MPIENDNVSWDDITPNPKGGGNRPNGVSLFMKLDPRPEPYSIRLACKPVRFRKHGWCFRSLKQYPISPASDISEKDLDIAWNEGKFMPATRYAAWVFDRDNGRLRILEASPDVYGVIGNHAQVTKSNPASQTKGWDWLIQVTEEDNGKGNGGKIRKFAVTIDTGKGPTPFTPEEIKLLDNPKFSREELEGHYFVKLTPEELKDLWDQLPEGARMNEPRGQKGDKPPAKNAARQAPEVSKVSETTKPVEVAEAEEPMDDTFLSDPDASTDASNPDGQESARLF